jgi:hypothetical protein
MSDSARLGPTRPDRDTLQRLNLGRDHDETRHDSIADVD